MPTVIPIVDQTRKGSFWFKKDIFTGPNGQGNIVPNVPDMLFDPVTGWEIVTEVNYTTNLTTSVPYSMGGSTGVNEEDILLGSNYGLVGEAYRIFVNTDVVPHRMAFDNFLKIHGSNVSHVKVFKGIDISNSGQVVSAMFNASGVMTSENIPTETVRMPNGDLTGIKMPVEGWCTESLLQGELVTAVCYSVTGAITGITRLAVHRSNYIRTIDESKRFITGIELVSPFMSTTNPLEAEVPFNLLIQSGSFLGKVNFSDGSSSVLAIDGTKFSLFGLENFITGVPHQSASLVLRYSLSPSEFSYVAGAPVPDRAIAKAYRLRTVEADGRYTVKLFAVPTWDAPNARWSLQYFLYNVDRQAIYNVTPHVTTGVGFSTFNGTLYGVVQNLTVTVNTNVLGASFGYFQHVQSFKVMLQNPATNNVTNTYWYLEYSDGVRYGENRFAGVRVTPGNPTTKNLDIANGFATVAAWLAEMYVPLEALYLSSIEVNRPTPTHVRLVSGSWSRELTIASVLDPIVGISEPLPQAGLLRLEFINRDSNGDKQIAMGALNLKAT